MAEASLVGMPLELLVHMIATYLPTKDLGALRLTCKYLEKALFDTFAKEFFAKKQFMLSTFSLDVLIKISKHAALAPFVRHVIIGLDLYTEVALGHNHVWPNVTQFEAWRDGWADQQALMSSGRDRQMLAEAFRNLPNLETVGIRDYDARGRTRDDEQWHSYGAPTVFRETGLHLRSAVGPEAASGIFTLLLQALADVNKPCPNVEVIIRGPVNSLNDFAFFLPAVSNMKPVLDGLQRLLLTMTQGHLANPRIQGASRERSLLALFLARTPALKHLRLNFHPHERISVLHVLEGLSSTSNLLPNLKRLELGMATLTPDLLSQVICGIAPNLCHVGLWKVTLTMSVLPRWRDSKGRFDPWPRLLRDLANDAKLSLQSVSLGCLKQHDATVWQDIRVGFANGQVSQEGAGDMKVFIPQLIASLKVEWPGDQSDNEDENMSDESESESQSESEVEDEDEDEDD